jgi:hypothetical protein
MTSVASPSITLPSQFALNQNYPNPFNPITTISFSLPSASSVTVKVCDVLGREVGTILSEEMSAGTYTRHWTAAGLASGVYFYRLFARGLSDNAAFIETRRLVLMK